MKNTENYESFDLEVVTYKPFHLNGFSNTSSHNRQGIGRYKLYIKGIHKLILLNGVVLRI